MHASCVQVINVVTKQLLDLMAGFKGGLMGEGHSWV